MATISKRKLSGSTDGKGIKVAATAIGSGTTIHDSVSGTTDLDLITIFCYNDDTSERSLILGWGGTTDPDDLIITPIPPQSGLVLVAADLPLQNGLDVLAACATANVLTIHGYVNRIDA